MITTEGVDSMLMFDIADCPDTTVEREEVSRTPGWIAMSFGLSPIEKDEWPRVLADGSDGKGPIALIASTVAWNSRARLRTSSRLLVARLVGDAGRPSLTLRVSMRAGVLPMVAELATDIGLVNGVLRVPGAGMAMGAVVPAANWAAEGSGANGSITCISTPRADMLVVSDETLDTCGGRET